MFTKINLMTASNLKNQHFSAKKGDNNIDLLSPLPQSA